MVGAFSLKTETGTQEWDDDKKTTRRDSRKGTLQDDGIDSMLACWGTVWGKHVLPADRSARAAVSILYIILASDCTHTCYPASVLYLCYRMYLLTSTHFSLAHAL